MLWNNKRLCGATAQNRHAQCTNAHVCPLVRSSNHTSYMQFLS